MLRFQFSPILILITCLAVAACQEVESTSNPSSCEIYKACDWDEPIGDVEASSMLANWQHKWDSRNVPDSFLLNLDMLNKLVGSNCGFRVYPGLTDTFDIKSMCLVIVPVDMEKNDILSNDEGIIFTNVSATDGDDTNGQYISLDSAIFYTQNWRTYHRVCLTNDTLGNFTCPAESLPPHVIGPRGNYGEGLIQVIKLASAFAGEEVICKIDSSATAYTNYAIYNGMYPIMKNDTSNVVIGYVYDSFIRGVAPETSQKSEAIDITSPCPLDCGDTDILQTNSD